MTDKPVHIVRMFDPKDTSTVRYVGPGTPERLRYDQPALKHPDPAPQEVIPGAPKLIECGRMGERDHVHVITLYPAAR